MRILALTVGGSCAPIVKAIEDYAPTYVCFFASTGSRGSARQVEGEGKPCGRGDDKRPAIVSQVGLDSDHYEIVRVETPDDLSYLYGLMLEHMRHLESRYGQAEYIADYTGGTKSMGAALVLAAIQRGWQLSLVTGQRTNLVQVAPGTEIAEMINTASVRARQQMEMARALFNDYAYKSAEAVLSELSHSGIPDHSLREQIRRRVTLCRGFDAWDKFDHERAYQILKTVQSMLVPQWKALKRIYRQRQAEAEPGYELVLDLIRNAERRQARGRYDDAVARLYRALELLAQTRLRLRKPPLNSSNLDVALLPADLREQYEARRDADGKIRLGLHQDYELLRELGDPLGEVYARHGHHLLNALSKRNNSILAHGITPIADTDCHDMLKLVREFVEQALTTLKVRASVPQFPHMQEDGTLVSSDETSA